MKYLFFLITSLFTGFLGLSQKPDYTTINPKFSKKINFYLSYSVPVVSVSQLKKMDKVTIFDAREKEEFNISHIPNAKYLGYKDWDENLLKNIPKDQTLVLYCSIGYRSEKIAEKLKKKGFKNVYNLYGSIFEWANEGQPLQDNQGNTTNKIHVYNKSWGQWMENKNYVKVY
jgi:rhodanese-related sulfurtransferase